LVEKAAGGEDLMYVSTWPGLALPELFPSRSGREMPYPLNAAHRHAFCVARSGIYHLFRALRLKPGEKVLAPDYYSGNEIAAIQAAGASLVHYPIRRNLEPDMEALSRLAREIVPRVIYVIHYLGWPQPMEDIKSLCRESGSILVEDCALSLLSKQEDRWLGTFGDYSIFCLYKTLPVPNGGLLIRNNRSLPELDSLTLERCPALAAAGRSVELAFETLRSRANGTGKALFAIKQTIGRTLRAARVRHVPVGDIGWNIANVNIAMSGVSDRVMRSLDYERIIETRRSNFLLMRQRLEGRVRMLREDLKEGVCPLFFPILVRDKHAAARALGQRDIGAVEFWNDRQDNPSIGADARWLRSHVLELPIHQGVTSSQVEYIADQVLRLQLEPAPC
jgi:dTDP-4-amino-4,6-dideoxygalactose transaminase